MSKIIPLGKSLTPAYLQYGELVFQYLKRHPNGAVSDSELSRQTGISRKTLWRYRQQICKAFPVRYRRGEGLLLDPLCVAYGERILQHLRKRPRKAISERELARQLGIPRTTLQYHRQNICRIFPLKYCSGAGLQLDPYWAQQWERAVTYYGQIIHDYLRERPGTTVSIVAMAETLYIGKTTIYKYLDGICETFHVKHVPNEGLLLECQQLRLAA